VSAKPFTARLREALLAGRRDGVRGHGGPALRRSDGYEFAELREYVDGDDPRRIDWAATARAGALQTRVFLEERALMLATVVDASGSMRVGRRRTNYELACDAAALWYGAASDDDRCARIGTEALVLRGLPGRSGALACAAGRDTPDMQLETALRLALAVLPRGTRLLIASDFYDVEESTETLRACARRFELTALLVRDPWFAGLPLGGFVRLRDAENGRSVRAFVDKGARERFRRAVADREGLAIEHLGRLGAHAGMLDDEAGAESALARIFRL
jgi:uncharacterized protein (DUF58 family)